MDKEIRNVVLYLIGILVLVALIMAALTYLGGSNGFNFVFGDPDSKVYVSPPDIVIEEGVDYRATITTNLGVIEYDLLENNAPTTVNNFVFLARENYYDGVNFHRIVPDFIIQSGSRLSLDDDPSNDGLGGPGYRFDDEINWSSLNLDESEIENLEAAGFSSDTTVSSVAMVKYSLAMANSGPNTNGSQFFITVADLEDPSIQNLEGRHTVFGRIISGQEVVNQIANQDLIAGTERPITEIIIESVEITEQ